MKTFEETVESLNWTHEKEASWLRKYRESAFEKFRKIGFPDYHHEAWKYIRLNSILKTPLRRSDLRDYADLAYTFTIDQATPAENRLVFVDGVYSPEHSSLNSEKGLTVQTFRLSKHESLEFVKPYAEKTLELENNAFALINSFSFADGIVVKISEQAQIKHPIRIIFVEDKNTQVKQVYHSKIMVIAEHASKGTFKVEHAGNGFENYFANIDFEIHAKSNSQIDWVNVTEDGFHFATSRAFLDKSAALRVINVNLNQSLVRNEIRVDLEGENAQCLIAGTSLLDFEAQAFEHILINHLVPNCSSKQIYKNILAGNSKIEFNSLSHVHRGAQKSDSNQLNKNLLLSDTARAYSRPQLKIYADDVKATHGSATGPLLNEELFYLKSRGIDAKLAHTTLTFGFAEEVLELIEFPFLRNQIEQRAQTLLGQMIRTTK